LAQALCLHPSSLLLVIALMAGAAGASGVRGMLTPVAIEVSLCREAARASALAAHSAAGLCASAQLRTAARLMRSAEALSRAAVTALGAALAKPLAETAGSPSTLETAALPSSARTRRRRKHKKAGKSAVDPMDDDTGEAEILGIFSGCAAPPPVQLGAVAAEPAPPRRVLAAKTSRERSPRRAADVMRSPSPSSSLSSPAGEIFVKDAVVVLSGLAARPELNGTCATVLSFDGASGRYAVRLPTAEDIRVRAPNVVKLPPGA
jgi:hypothetical protein